MYIGIDVGGTSCRIAATDNLHNIANFTKKDFRLTHNFDQDFATMQNLISELSRGHVDGIGIGTPGGFNENKTIITSTVRNLIEWKNQPIKERLVNTFHCNVFLENDAVTAALGEAYFGNGKDQDFTYIIWGTGVGGATVTWKEDKAEVTKLDWHRYLETWENACGGNNIRKTYGKPAESLSEEEWADVMQKYTKELTIFSTKTQPTLIIFGGGIAIKQTHRLLTIQPPQGVTLKISALGEETGLYGALSLLK